MDLSNYRRIKAELEESGVILVAVSKTKPPEMIREMYDAGQRVFGENRVQELLDKHEVLPADIRWHLIGHLQRNKVKYIAPFIDMIESVDSVKLLRAISHEAEKADRTIDILLQFKIAEEETKYGLELKEALQMLSDPELRQLPGIRYRGVMGMASFVDDMNQVRLEFRTLRDHFKKIREKHFPNNPFFNTISMGMSGDYKIAIQEGSNMVRIGSLLFGPRE